MAEAAYSKLKLVTEVTRWWRSKWQWSLHTVFEGVTWVDMLKKVE